MGHTIAHGTNSSTLADVLERVLDKGIVVAGDIRVRIADIDLIAIQIRLVVCSVDKAREMGMDWWVNNPVYQQPREAAPAAESIAALQQAIARLEQRLEQRLGPADSTAADPLPAGITQQPA
ncbi:MAG: gas vesicle protein [Acidobacteria bacterium]|nr:gas vesicle protein [Acidobacteriota bacterium]